MSRSPLHEPVPLVTPPSFRRVQAIKGIEVHAVGRSDQSTSVLNMHNMRTFRPLGFFVWGVNDRTRIESVHARGQIQPIENVPAIFFTTGRSFQELAEQAQSGQLSVEGWKAMTICTLEVGQMLQVRVKGEISAMAVWGWELEPDD